MARRPDPRWPRVAAVGVALVTVVVAWPSLMPGCVSLELSSSIEPGKVEVLQRVAHEYNGEDRRVDGHCVEVSVHGTTSGLAMQKLRDGWARHPPTDGEGEPVAEPQVWVPTSSMWLELLRHSGQVTGLPGQGDWQSLTQSVLVVAMPETMARALGWPQQEVDWERMRQLSDSGWGPLGHPEWGAFSFGKDNPHLSTSGLAATVATFYAGANLVNDRPPGVLTPADVDGSAVFDFVQGVEAGVHNYDDDIVDFLRNMARYDADGNALAYASAVVLQEQLVAEYNTGAYSPDHRVPDERLVTFYPAASTLRLDHPYVVLPWASELQRGAAEDFFSYLQAAGGQEDLARIGFRHRSHDYEPWALHEDVAESVPGQRELEDTSLVRPPDGETVARILRQWDDLRRPANILLVLDTSSSMRDPARIGTVRAAVDEGLERLLEEAHQVGLWTFPSAEPARQPYDRAVELGPLRDVRGDIEAAVDGLVPDRMPGGPTPLYRTIAAACDDVVRRGEASPDGDRDPIDAVVVLTDGGNNDPDDATGYSFDQLLDDIDARRRERAGEPSVKVFTIGFGEDAEYPALEQISAATRAQAYDASDPATLDDIFLDVIDNF